MNNLYACISESNAGVSPAVPLASRRRIFADQDSSAAAHLRARRPQDSRRDAGVTLARRFSHRIEVLDYGVLFDISGLHKSVGWPSLIASKIWKQMREENIEGNLAVASSAETAILYARSRPGVTVIDDRVHQKLPLESLGLEQDKLNVFRALGLEDTADLKKIPEAELIARYGSEFRKVVDLINQNGVHVLTPNLKEETVAWDYNLDFPVDDFERLVFILGHGLGKVLGEAAAFGFSSEQIDISLKLEDKTEADYSIKLSFPTMEKSFWLKLINLRISNDPPPAAILSIRLVCRFARPRAVQRGLYSATRPEPESLLLTVDKIKNLVGGENVGVPVLVDQRLPEAFRLDFEKLPSGKEQKQRSEPRPVLALTYFHPPLAAEISVHEGRLMHLRTRYFAGKVVQYGGMWKQSSQWWERSFWERTEWDVELDNRRVYRIVRAGEEWVVIGAVD